jgi:hypothetical protein
MGGKERARHALPLRGILRLATNKALSLARGGRHDQRDGPQVKGIVVKAFEVVIRCALYW